MKADGVRYLCLCPVCGKLGDERRMVRAGLVECLAHDRCVFEQLGEGILNLFPGQCVEPRRCQRRPTLRRPRHHRGRLLLDQIGAEFCLDDQVAADLRLASVPPHVAALGDLIDVIFEHVAGARRFTELGFVD